MLYHAVISVSTQCQYSLWPQLLLPKLWAQVALSTRENILILLALCVALLITSIHLQVRDKWIQDRGTRNTNKQVYKQTGMQLNNLKKSYSPGVHSTQSSNTIVCTTNLQKLRKEINESEWRRARRKRYWHSKQYEFKRIQERQILARLQFYDAENVEEILDYY